MADTLGQYRQWDTSKGPIPEDAGGTARVIPAGGGDPIPLAAGRVGFPTWSPEGHALVYVELPNTLKLLPEPNGRATDLPAVDQAIEKLRTADTITAGDGVRLNSLRPLHPRHGVGARVTVQQEVLEFVVETVRARGGRMGQHVHPDGHIPLRVPVVRSDRR